MKRLAVGFAIVAAPMLGCADGPCSNIDGPLLFAWDQGSAHRLAGTNASAFSSISDALDAATDGTAVCVGPGVWQENLTISTNGVRLFGSGSGSTVIEPTVPTSDPRTSDTTVIKVDAVDVILSGISLRGGEIGLELMADSGVTLLDMEMRTNQFGITGTDISSVAANGLYLIRNSNTGAIFTANSESDTTVQIANLEVIGNGDATVSAVGGLRSDMPLDLNQALFKDNAGVSTADLLAQNGITAQNLTVEMPYASSSEARVSLYGDTILHSASFALSNGGIEIDCLGGLIDATNMAVSNSLATPVDNTMEINDCNGSIIHATFARLGDPLQGTGLELTGSGELTIANTAFVNFVEAFETGDTIVTETANFIGELADAQLIMPLSSTPNLRPQLDSPLIDAGEDLGIQLDLTGWQRPRGTAPDIGAFER
jgi:hypothetical protein